MFISCTAIKEVYKGLTYEKHHHQWDEWFKIKWERSTKLLTGYNKSEIMKWHGERPLKDSPPNCPARTQKRHQHECEQSLVRRRHAQSCTRCSSCFCHRVIPRQLRRSKSGEQISRRLQSKLQRPDTLLACVRRWAVMALHDPFHTACLFPQDLPALLSRLSSDPCHAQAFDVHRSLTTFCILRCWSVSRQLIIFPFARCSQTFGATRANPTSSPSF